MVVRLKLLVEDSDSVPELGIFDIVEGVERMLVRVKGLLQILNEEVAVTKGSPGRSVLGVNGG